MRAPIKESMAFLARVLDLATGGPLAEAIARAARRHWAPERGSASEPHGR